MNEYKYSDLEIGQEEKFSVEITEKMLSDFFMITGDSNPLHHDDSFAKQMNFRNKVVFGMLTASFISTLAGVYLPGRYCLIRSVESKFLQPVFVGDKLDIVGIVEAKHDSVQQVDIKVVITNQKCEKVLRGKLKVGILDE